MNQITVNGYTRISKQKARKMYNAGEDIYLVPCKMVPGNCWGMMYNANYYNWNKCELFETIVAIFEMYNCRNELGNYAAFYKKDKTEVDLLIEQGYKPATAICNSYRSEVEARTALPRKCKDYKIIKVNHPIWGECYAPYFK